MKWIIENFDEDPAYTRLADEVIRQGMECKYTKYIPFMGGEYEEIPNNSEECVLFYGSLNLARQLRRNKKWIPGVWCNLPNFLCSQYYVRYETYLLNSDAIFLPLGLLKNRISTLYKTFGVDNCLFIRPDSGYKDFTGKTVSQDSFESEYDWMTSSSTPDSLVVIASPKKIEKEWRFFVGPEGIISGCTSHENSVISMSPKYDSRAASLASEIASNFWKPDPLFVVDICKSNGNYYLLEINAFSCSGLYECDPEPIVRVASAVAIEENLSYRA
jgi:hypothetical protein